MLKKIKHPITNYLSIFYMIAVLTFIVGLYIFGKNKSILLVNLFFSIIQFIWVLKIILRDYNKLSDIQSLLLPFATFNLAFLLLSQLHGFDYLFRSTDFRVGFPFGNYMDFYSAIVYSFTVDGIKLLFQTGYYPFSILCARLFGYLIGLSSENLNFSGFKPFIFYTFIYLSCLLPLIYYIKSIFRDNKIARNIFIFIVVTSYPLLFLYERGNLVIFSVLLLTLSLRYELCRPKLFLLFLSLLISIKLVNVIFIILLFNKPLKDKLIGLLYFVAIQFTSVLILNCLQGELNLSILDLKTLFLNATIKPAYVFSDSIKIFATSGLDSMRLAIVYLNSNLFADGGLPFNIKLFYILPSALLILIYCSISYYKKLINPKILIIFIYVTLALFHPTYADYSLTLLLPLIVYLISDFQCNKKLINLLLILFLSIGILPIMEIQCCGGQIIPGRVVFLTIKSFIYPLVYILILFNLFSDLLFFKKERV